MTNPKISVLQENTPRTIVMCIAFLARNPLQLNEIRAEIDNILKNKRVPSLNDLDKLRYTEMVSRIIHTRTQA